MRVLANIACLQALLAWSVGALSLSAAADEPSPAKPNILISSIESLRWDRLGVAGYSRPITTNIDALAARGTYFRHNYSQSSWTRPSVASTFTSTYRSTHRVFGEQDQDGIKPHLRKAGETSKLRESFETLAEAFSAHGYRCGGWTHNSQLWKGFGFAQGFSEYKAVGVTDKRALANLERFVRGDRAQPFLVFVHLVTPHSPYKPEQRFRTYGTLRANKVVSAKLRDRIIAGKGKLSPADLKANVDLYDGAVAQVDTYVGRVLRLLDDTGIADHTIVVLMADHGEEFYDHGGISHGHTVYDELIRVPLILAGPKIPRAKTIDLPVQNIDLFPTLLELALNEKRSNHQGDSLVPMLKGEPVDPSRPVFSESKGLHAVRQGNWKFILHPESGSVKLYDLAADPYEQRDRADDPEVASEQKHLAGRMAEFLETNERPGDDSESEAEQEIPADVLDNLKALGYLE